MWAMALSPGTDEELQTVKVESTANYDIVIYAHRGRARYVQRNNPLRGGGIIGLRTLEDGTREVDTTRATTTDNHVMPSEVAEALRKVGIAVDPKFEASLSGDTE